MTFDDICARHVYLLMSILMTREEISRSLIYSGGKKRNLTGEMCDVRKYSRGSPVRY